MLFKRDFLRNSRHQLLPEQCQVEAVDSAVCVEVSGLPLGLCQGAFL